MTRPIRHDTIPRRARRTLYKADQLLRRPPPTSGAYYEIAVFYDEEPVTVDRTFTWPIPLGVNGLAMIHVEAGLTAVVGSSATIVQLHNVTQAVDMLSTRITIDSGEFASFNAVTQPVIDDVNAVVERGDRIRIEIDAAGSGAYGLCVMVRFGVPQQTEPSEA